MPSLLTVHINNDERGAKLMRGTTQIGAFEFDREFQLQGVTIAKAASPAEREQIIRLASSHVAQYCVTGRRFYQTMAGGLLRATQQTVIPPIDGLTRAHSRRLLDFNNLPEQHARMTVGQLRDVLSQVGVQIVEQRR